MLFDVGLYVSYVYFVYDIIIIIIIIILNTMAIQWARIEIEMGAMEGRSGVAKRERKERRRK